MKTKELELLKKVEQLWQNELFALSRLSDDKVLSVTDDISQLTRMIREELCVQDVILLDVTYQKHDYTYDIKVNLIEDDGEEIEEEFKLSTVIKY